MFQKCRGHVKILGATGVTWRTFHNQDPQMLDATANWRPGFVHASLKKQRITLLTLEITPAGTETRQPIYFWSLLADVTVPHWVPASNVTAGCCHFWQPDGHTASLPGKNAIPRIRPWSGPTTERLRVWSHNTGSHGHVDSFRRFPHWRNKVHVAQFWDRHGPFVNKHESCLLQYVLVAVQQYLSHSPHVEGLYRKMLRAPRRHVGAGGGTAPVTLKTGPKWGWSAPSGGRFGPCTLRTEDWMGPNARVGTLEQRKIACFCRESNHDSSVVQPTV
jgi:hypothetical protein